MTVLTSACKIKAVLCASAISASPRQKRGSWGNSGKRGGRWRVSGCRKPCRTTEFTDCDGNSTRRLPRAALTRSEAGRIRRPLFLREPPRAVAGGIPGVSSHKRTGITKSLSERYSPHRGRIRAVSIAIRELRGKADVESTQNLRRQTSRYSRKNQKRELDRPR